MRQANSTTDYFPADHMQATVIHEQFLYLHLESIGMTFAWE